MCIIFVSIRSSVAVLVNIHILHFEQHPENYTKLRPGLLISDCDVPPNYGQTTLEAVDYIIKQSASASGEYSSLNLF